jgi:hypothetical protein
MFSPSTFSPSPFVSSPKRLSSNRLTRTLHDSLLQGNILPSRGPRHPRPAPLVSQVVLSPYVIDWGECLGALDIAGDSFLFSQALLLPSSSRLLFSRSIFSLTLPCHSPCLMCLHAPPSSCLLPSGTLVASTPLTCTAGSYCAIGSTATAPCPSGHYCLSPSSLVPCPAGVVEWDPG